MRAVLIGGGGLLGRSLAPGLEARGIEVSAYSRSTSPAVDVRTGQGLASALDGADVVVHLASNPSEARATDIDGTRRILEIIGGKHLVYMSIVGVDQHPFGYYQAKFQAEQLIAEAGVSHTIVRATQFHDFLAFLMSKACRRWMGFIPSGFVFQPIDTHEVAEALADAIEAKPQGLLADLAGPEVLEVEHIARTYMTARGREAPLVKLPVPGRTARAFREGVHTNPDRAIGSKTWEEHLEKTFQS